MSLETVRREVVAVAKRSRALRAVLFGSCARGPATERSDVDPSFAEAARAILEFIGRSVPA